MREPAKYEDAVIDEAEILESMPVTVRHKAKRLIRIIKENPQLTWNERGELIHKQTTIHDSSIVELISDILKQKRVGDERPLGWREFSESLAESGEISKELVPNYDSWRVLSQNKRPVSAVATAPASVEVDKRQRPRERQPAEEIRRTERRLARKSLSWEPY